MDVFVEGGVDRKNPQHLIDLYRIDLIHSSNRSNTQIDLNLKMGISQLSQYQHLFVGELESVNKLQMPPQRRTLNIISRCFGMGSSVTVGASI